MPLTLLILAESDDDGVAKYVFIGIFLAIWAVSAMISSWNKKVDEERKRRQLGRLPQDLAQQRPRPARQTPVAGQYGYPVPPPPPPAAARQRKQKRRRQAAAPVPPAAPEPVPAAAPGTYIDHPSKGPNPPDLPEAARIARLVHRPDSLRAALILNEVLSPPVSLRDE